MDDIRMRFYNPLISQTPINTKAQSVSTNTTNTEQGVDFSEVLAEKMANVNFSKHAIQRVMERNIDVSEDSMLRLNEGMKMASEKNLKDALIIVDKTAFIVNVPSNTVITTTQNDDLKGNVFTNINGTVII